MLEVRPAIEREVMRRLFPGATSMASLNEAQRDQLEDAIAVEMNKRWIDVRDQVTADSRASLDQTRALLQAFRSAYVQFQFAPNRLGVKARALMDFR